MLRNRSNYRRLRWNIAIQEALNGKPVEYSRGAISACKFYVLSVLRLGPTHCKRPAKREDGEE